MCLFFFNTSSSKWVQHVIRSGLLVSAGLLVLTACRPPTTPPIENLPPFIPVNTPTSIATPSGFTYGVTVLDTDNQPVENAHVLIEIEGQAPLDEYADANGYARIVVPSTHAERPGKLTVNA